MGMLFSCHQEDGSLTFPNSDNPAFRTLRYALPNSTEECSHRDGERSSEVGEEGGKQVVP